MTGTQAEKTDIVDAHVHLWDPRRIRYPWLVGVPALDRPFTLKEFRFASAIASVSAMVFVEADAHREDKAREFEWISALTRQHSPVRAIVAYAPLELGCEVREWLDALVASPLVRGVRRILQSENDLEFCLRPDFIEGVRALRDYGLTFDLCICDTQLSAAVRLAERVPEVTMILDHVGKPPIRGRRFKPWADAIRALASSHNVVCKISGMATEANYETWTSTQLQPYIELATEAFGFDRILFGSDWPVSTQAISYGGWIVLLQRIFAGVERSKLHGFWATNARRVYSI